MDGRAAVGGSHGLENTSWKNSGVIYATTINTERSIEENGCLGILRREVEILACCLERRMERPT
jgi:hypothetical protein